MYQFLHDNANAHYQALIHEVEHTRLVLQARTASKPKTRRLRRSGHR
jgi:hypothetical protein